VDQLVSTYKRNESLLYTRNNHESVVKGLVSTPARCCVRIPLGAIQFLQQNSTESVRPDGGFIA
jgi:hypothetical protein